MTSMIERSEHRPSTVTERPFCAPQLADAEVPSAGAERRFTYFKVWCPGLRGVAGAPVRAREPVRAVGQQPPQLLPGPHPLAQPADAEELVRRVQPVHGLVLATGSGVIAAARTTAARWPRSGSWRRSGRRPG